MAELLSVPQLEESCAHPRPDGAEPDRLFVRLPDDLALDLAEVFGVLADSTRLRIIAALMHGEVCVCELAEQLSLRQSTVSHQLRLLRNLRLVSFRKEGRTVYYRLCDEHVATLLRQTLDHLLEERSYASGPAAPNTQLTKGAALQ
ncbi:MAG: metalloregulator ArsR/SmtB family transcription factor [Chloroflexota bacterium]|nr:metalloregulator ArsR/SmtB family transcription factor [Chloroflexota bacterium]